MNNDEHTPIPAEELCLADTEASSPVAEAPSELDLLRSEIASLRTQLEEREQARREELSRLAEFRELFPNASPEQLPDSVREDVERGIPLIAAYALYEKKEATKAAAKEAVRSAAEAVNRVNASLSSGPAGKDGERDFFSPEEVRGMTPRQVHDNYRSIRESMKRWKIGNR